MSFPKSNSDYPNFVKVADALQSSCSQEGAPFSGEMVAGTESKAVSQIPLEVGAKEFKEDFVQRRLNIERAFAVAAVVVSVIALVVLISLAVHGYSNCQYETYRAFCECCHEVHDMTRCLTPALENLGIFSTMGAAFSGAAVLGSSVWLGATLIPGAREDSKENMEEWFAEPRNKRSLKAIHKEYYNQCTPAAHEGVAPAVREGVLPVAEGIMLSRLMKDYHDLSDKEGVAANHLASQWTEFLDNGAVLVEIDSQDSSEVEWTEFQGAEITLNGEIPSNLGRIICEKLGIKFKERDLIDLTSENEEIEALYSIPPPPGSSLYPVLSAQGQEFSLKKEGNDNE